MQDLLAMLTCENRSAKLPAEFDYFGKLIGDWKIEFVDNDDSRSIAGEWHFSWILEGTAVQDVIVLPGFEYGTTIRIFNPSTLAWDVVYFFNGKNIRLEARKQDDKIILTSLENERRKWVFNKIEDNYFHWQDVTVQDDGRWHIACDIYAERLR